MGTSFGFTGGTVGDSFRYHRAKIDLSDKNTSVAQLVLLTGRGKKVLEIGPATGYVSQALQRRGCRVTGVEKDPAAAAVAAKFCQRMVVADVEQLDFAAAFGGERFDVVIFGDVLEHLVDPKATLVPVAEILEPGGYVVASVPNIAHGSIRLALLGGDFRYTELGLLDRTHLHLFTRQSLGSLFREAGYRIGAWRRIIVDPFATEVPVREADYPAPMVASLRDEPEAMTYQYVVRAYPVASARGPTKGPPAEALVSHHRPPVMGALQKMEKEIFRLEGALAERDSLLAQKDAALQQQQAALAQREALIHNQEAALREARQELGTIHQSLGYRLLEAYRGPVRWLFPPGSWRSVPYRALVGLIRFLLPAPEAAVAGGRWRRPFRLAARALKIVRTEGWRALLRKAKDRLTRDYGPGSRPRMEAELVREFRPLRFPSPERPKASIVIPVHNKSLYTFNCLLSILLNTEDVPYEVIVVDDASSDDTKSMLHQAQNVQVWSNPRNLGFVHSCNKGTELAGGQLLVFLNNDTKVHKGWLAALVETLEQDDSIGLVGPKLIYPNGRLQEAGAIVWNDGSGWNYGRHDDPEKPEYNYRREVDYCSGACFLVRRDLFEKAGGFDQRYAPAYYEDTDLAFAIRQMGFRVVYQPKAVITHFEGVSAGTDTASGMKRYQEINRSKFVEKWRTVLERDYFSNAKDLLLARDRRNSGRALVIDHHVPTHDRDSGSLRMFNILRLLAELGFVITFVPDNLARMEPYTQELQQMGIEVLYGPKDVTDHLRGLGQHLRLAILSRPDVAAKYMPMIRRLAPGAAIFYDTVDLHFLREERRAEVEKSPSARKAAQRYRELELLLARTCDATITVTEAEKTRLEQEVSGLRAHVIPNIHEVGRSGRPFCERQGLLFIGSFLHPPNQDAVTYFVRDVFPLIRREVPDVPLFIVGSDPNEDVKALASGGVVVTGWVPDVAPYLESARVFVAPLRYGAGLKGKIGQSMGFGLPVVTTSIGAEGMEVADGREVLITDDPAEFADKVVRLLREEELWAEVSENAMGYIAANYAPEVVLAKMKEILSQHGLLPSEDQHVKGEAQWQPTFR